MTNPILGFKAFDQNFQCRKFQFEVGETYRYTGAVIPCESGFHFCTRPLDILQYYRPTSRFAIVEGSGEMKTHEGDSKVAAEILTIQREIGLAEFCEEGAKAILVGVDWSGAKAEGEARSAATNTGHYSAATNTGHYSAATNTGDQSAATNTGHYSAATNTGHYSAATNTGHQSAAIVEGAHSVAVVTGAGSKARGALGCAIMMIERNDDYSIKSAAAVIVDGVKVKPNTFYALKNGELVEA